MPIRIQRKRTKDWRMPEGAVYVGRPTKWGNSCRVYERCPFCHVAIPDPQDAVAAYRLHVVDDKFIETVKTELAGKDLACWCPLVDADGNHVPCHADVLLELANTN